MFTEIGIENFKAFGKMQRIPLKPITLLYGPNSSGKSSLMQSLLLLKQTLEESGDDKIILLPKGNLVDLGSYQEFINGHDVRKKFYLSISFKYSWDKMVWYDCIQQADPSLEFTFAQDKSGEILLSSIKTMDRLNPNPILECRNVWSIPYLRRAVLERKAQFEKGGDSAEVLDKWLNDLKKSVMVMDHINMANWLPKYMWEGCAVQHPIRGPKIVYGDPTHSYYKETKDDLKRLSDHLKREREEIEAENDKLLASSADLKDEELEEKRDRLTIRRARFRQLKQILRLLRDLHRSLMRASFEDVLKIHHFPCSDRLISLSNCFPDDKNKLSGEEGWLFQNIPEFASLGKPDIKINELYEMLNPIHYYFPSVSSLLKEYLRRIIYIGPLREYPERVYSYSGNTPSNVGKSGKYTPDILLKRPDLVDKVNEWFNRFEIGYTLQVDILKRNLFALSLTDRKTSCEVSPKDVGFGIGQLLPILVQGVLSENKILFIEQPEIHVHPRLQAELGSFIAEMASRVGLDPSWAVDSEEEVYGNQFIIETHSEHLILRLLRLIRDTTNGELKEGEKPLRPEDVAVIYAKPTEHGTELMELRISEDGDFIDKWPDGFFTEREKELF